MIEVFVYSQDRPVLPEGYMIADDGKSWKKVNWRSEQGLRYLQVVSEIRNHSCTVMFYCESKSVRDSVVKACKFEDSLKGRKVLICTNHKKKGLTVSKVCTS